MFDSNFGTLVPFAQVSWRQQPVWKNPHIYNINTYIVPVLHFNAVVIPRSLDNTATRRVAEHFHAAIMLSCSELKLLGASTVHSCHFVCE